MTNKKYLMEYFEAVKKVSDGISQKNIEKAINILSKVKKQKGRLFLLGIGGSAANCSHAVNDFRKIAHIETYTPADNVSELTARANDDGWDTIFSEWLKGSHLSKKDAIIVFSVGGGNIKKNVSTNIVSALKYAQKAGANIIGIVSRDGGYTKEVATVCILVPVISDTMITPLAESFQAVVWHAMVTSPELSK